MDLNDMTPGEYKIYENRLRRAAQRQGLALQKSRARDPRAIGYGTYQLVDVATNTMAAYSLPNGYGLTLDEIEETLAGKPVD